jgi:hypothetical protein
MAFAAPRRAFVFTASSQVLTFSMPSDDVYMLLHTVQQTTNRAGFCAGQNSANCALILPMQILGLSDSAPRTQSRIQSLFWSSIKTGSDVDYLGARGYWVYTAAAVLAFVFSVVSGHAIVATVVLLF